MPGTQHRARSLLLSALVLASAGGPRSRSWAQSACGTTGDSPLRVENLAGATALNAAVNCLDGGTVEAIWAGAVLIESTISVGSGTFLSITGEDDLAEVRGGAGVRLFGVSPSGGVSLTRLKLSGGTAENGGAIYSSGAVVTLDGCVFDSNNATAGDGGAVWAEGGNLTIVGGEFSGNSASGNGGAVQALDAAVVIQDGTRFEGNKAAEGGGLYCGGSGSGSSPAVDATCYLTGAFFTSNNASSEFFVDFDVDEDPTVALNGGGAASFYRGVVGITDSVFELNYAQVSGGAVFGGAGSNMNIDGCTFEENWTAGSGGALAASTATLGANTRVLNNSATDSGGGVFGWNANGVVTFLDTACSANEAGDKGGCLYASGGVLTTDGTAMRDNDAKTGGCVYGNGGSDIDIAGGEFTGCYSSGNGGFLFASDGAVVTVTAGTVKNNKAERRAGAVYCSGDSSDLGGSKVTIAGGTFSDNRALELGGALVAWGTNTDGPSPTVVTITGGTFTNNTAKFYGGFIFLEEQASLTCEGATITDHYAGDQGGGIYARDAIWVNSSCDFVGNRAPQGATAYMTYVTSANFANHNIMDTSAAGVSTVYAAETSVIARGVRFQEEIDPQADSSNRAVRLEGAATLTAEGCTFAGWIGDTVIHSANPTARSLVLNGCDFTESSAGTAVLSPNSDAEIRNAVVGAVTIKSASTANDGTPILVDHALGCDDARACGTGECLGSVLGVLCECLDGGDCLNDGGALAVSVKTPPDAVTYFPDSVYFELTVSAGSEGTTPAIWNLTHEVNDLSLQVVPSSGVLPPGEGVTVAVTGTPLQQDVGGNFKSRFVATSVGSGDSDSTSGVELEVESAFYLCQAFEYALPADDGGVTCEQCVTIQGADGVDCDEPGATLASLPLKPGYWRSTRESLVIHSCLNEEACAGATEVSSSDEYCADGYHGPYCAVCTEGYGAGTDYRCHACSGFKSRWLVVAGSIFIVLVAVAAVFGVMFLIGGMDAVQGVRRSIYRSGKRVAAERTMPSKRSVEGVDGGAGGPVFPVLEAGGLDQAKAGEAQMISSDGGGSVVAGSISTSATRRGGMSQTASARGRMAGCCDIGGAVKRLASRVPMNKVKILVVVFQILTVFPSVTGVEYPDVYSRFLSWVDVVNFDVATIFSASCFISTLDFYGKLLMMTLLPIGLASLLVATYRVAIRRAGGAADSLLGRAAWSRHMAAGLLLTFLVFTSTSTVIFQTFACDEDAVEGKAYLRADYSLSCTSTSHVWYRVYAAIMILVYPVGIPVLYGYILWINRESLNPKIETDEVAPAQLEAILQKRRENPDLVPSMFLWKDFGGSLYYFEVIDCGRRILLTGALIFVAPGTAAQAAVACMFAFASLLGFELMRPHLDPMDSWLYRLGCVVIFLSNFLALLIKVDATGESNRNILGGIMVAINVMLVGAVLLATWFATQQSVEDHREGECALGVAATMLTFEQRVAASQRLTRQQASASMSLSAMSSPSREGADLTPPVGETRKSDASEAVPAGHYAEPGSSGVVGILTAVERRGASHFGSNGGDFHL